MSKIDKLKLRQIEEIGDRELKMSPMSYGYGSSGSSDWYGGISESNCMSQYTYWMLVENGASITGVYVCGLGYIAGSVEIWGSSGYDEDWWSGSYDWGSGVNDWGSGYGSGSEYYGSSMSYNKYCPLCGGEIVPVSGSNSKYCIRCGNVLGGTNIGGGGGGTSTTDPNQSDPNSKWVGFKDSGNSWIGETDWRKRTTMNAKTDSCKSKAEDSNCEYLDGNVTYKGFCANYNFGNSYKDQLKCHLDISEHEACAGKEWSNKCRFTNEHGFPVDGKCSSYALGNYKGLYCNSELEIHT